MEVKIVWGKQGVKYPLLDNIKLQLVFRDIKKVIKRHSSKSCSPPPPIMLIMGKCY